MTRRPMILIAATTLAILSSCTRNKTLAEVGSLNITKNDVDLRMKAMAVFAPQQNESIALEQLIRSFTIAEVLKKKGLKDLDKEIDAEAKRIEDSAKGNPKMAEVKKTFGRDEASFKKIFVLPMLADRLAYTEGYLKDEDFHKAQKEKANQFLAEMQKSSGSFEETAKKYGFLYKKGSVDPVKGLVWDADKNSGNVNLPSGPFIAQQWKKAALDNTASGKVASSLIDQGNFWVALKNNGLASKDKGHMQIAAVAIFREPFGAWLEKNRSAVTVKRVADAKSGNPSGAKTN